MKKFRLTFDSVPICLLSAMFFVVSGCSPDDASEWSPVSTRTLAVAVPVDADSVDQSTTESSKTPVVRTSLKKDVVEKGYGDISGQIVFDGEVPELKLLIKKGNPAVKNPAICAAKNMFANDLLVDPKTKGIANAFVYIYHKNIERKGIKIHPEAAKIKDSEKEIVFDQKNCRFIPHVMVVRNGQAVRIKSADNCVHNTKVSVLFNDEFNTAISANDRKGVLLDTLTVPESLPMPVECNFHTWMKSHWLIINHPYATVTDKDGRFTIEKLPVGDIEFRIWHERNGYINRKYVVTVKEGKTQLEPVQVPAKWFEVEE